MLAMLGASSCYRTEEAFIRRFAKLSCIHDRECQREAYDMAWDSMKDCRADQEALLTQTIDEMGSGCVYQRDQGNECIHTTYRHRKDCGPVEDDLVEACTAVWVCSSGLELDEDPMAGAFEAALPRD